MWFVAMGFLVLMCSFLVMLMLFCIDLLYYTLSQSKEQVIKLPTLPINFLLRLNLDLSLIFWSLSWSFSLCWRFFLLVPIFILFHRFFLLWLAWFTVNQIGVGSLCLKKRLCFMVDLIVSLLEFE